MHDFQQAEACYGLWVPEGKWIILRLDGRGFSKMTETMCEKPSLVFSNKVCYTESK
jgi:tRNA(His) 5'-end guanylyltransferase